MKRYLVFFICMVFLVGIVNALVYYEVEVEYNNGKVEVLSVNPIYLRSEQVNFYSESENVSSYLVELKDNLGNVVYSEMISIGNFAFKHYGENGTITSGEIVYLDSIDFNLYFPYLENVNSIVIKENGKEDSVKEVSVSTFATVKSEDVSPRVPIKKEDDVKSGFNYLIILIVLILIVALIILYVYFNYVKKKI